MEAFAVEGLPEVRAGDDLAALIAERVDPTAGDVVARPHLRQSLDGEGLHIRRLRPPGKSAAVPATPDGPPH